MCKFWAVLEIEFGALHMLSKWSPTGLHVLALFILGRVSLIALWPQIYDLTTSVS